MLDLTDRRQRRFLTDTLYGRVAYVKSKETLYATIDDVLEIAGRWTLEETPRGLIVHETPGTTEQQVTHAKLVASIQAALDRPADDLG